jgi:hypothetical protein
LHFTEATGERGGVPTVRRKLCREFKWRLSPESRYANGGLVKAKRSDCPLVQQK